MDADQSSPEAPLARVDASPVYKIYFQANPSENTLFSPLSAEIILAALLSGLKGAAAKSLRDVLQLGDEDAEVLLLKLAADMRSIREGLVSSNMELASGMWTHADRIKLRKELREMFQDALRMAVKPVDFKDKAELKKLNRWVANATHGKISEIPIPSRPPWIPLDQPYPLFLAVNALYLKANWEIPFHPFQYRTDHFQCAGGDEREVEFMQLRVEDSGSLISYLENAHFQAVRIPTNDPALVVEFFLPREKGTLEASMDEILSGNWDAHFSTAERIFLLLPVFEVQDKIHFGTGALGKALSDLFRPGNDLDEMFEKENPEEPLSLTDIVQASTLRVDRKGLEAAAVTVGFGEPLGVPEPGEGGLITFEADHPFYFRVRHLETRRDLLVGTLCEAGKPGKVLSAAERGKRQIYRISLRVLDQLEDLDQEELRAWAAEKLPLALEKCDLGASAWSDLSQPAKWNPLFESLVKIIGQGKVPRKKNEVEACSKLVKAGWKHPQAVEMVRQAIRYPILLRLASIALHTKLPEARFWTKDLVREALEIGLEV